MKLIGFAAGPLHIICINEYIKKFKIKSYEIYLFNNKTDLVNKQINITVDFLKLRNIKNHKTSRINFISKIQNIIFALKLWQVDKNSNPSFLIMDFRNTLMHFLRYLFINSKFTLIDDGTSTFFNYQKYIKRKHFLPHRQYDNLFGYFNKYIIFNYKFRELLYKEIEIFTIYANELNLPLEHYNNLNFLKEKLKKNKFVYDNSTVFFSGTKLAERGAMSYGDEISLIMKISDYWKKRNKRLIYVTKRTTSEKKISMLKKKSIDCVSFDLPLEIALFIYSNKSIPKDFCSFGSTLDKTLPLLYKNLKVHLINFKGVKVSEELKEDLDLSKQMTLLSKDFNIIKI